MQQTSGQGCGIFGFLAKITCRNEFANRNTEFWPSNMSKKGVNKLPSAKMGTSHRGIQFFHDRLAESMLLRDD